MLRDMPLPHARPAALLVTLTAAIGALLVPTGASAADRTVDAATGTNVGTCGVSPCKTVAYALLWSAPGDRILVHPGTYAEQVTINNGKALVASGTPRPTIDGGVGTAVSVTGPGVRVEGLRLRGDVNAVSVSGAADDTVVKDNVFDDTAANDTGKVAVANGDVTITGNAFTADPQVNSGVGVATYTAGTAEIGGNTFAGFFNAVRVSSNPSHPANVHDNVLSGIHSKTPSIGWGIHATGSVSLTGNTITAGAVPGTASGVSLNDQGVAAVSATRRNRVSGFAANGLYAAMTVASSTATFVGDVATGNGSGIAVYNGKPTIRGATVVGNTDREIYLGNATTPLKLASSIVGDKGINTSGSSCTITFSRGPSTAGSSCQQFQTSADPGFAGPGDYHLTATSPLVDAGDPGLPLVGETDVDGHPRALIGLASGACKPARRDIGALEYAPDPAIGCPPVDPGPLPGPENPIDPGTLVDPGTPGDPQVPADSGTPGDPGVPADPGTPSEPGPPQTPGTPADPQAPPARGAITVIDDQGKAIALTLDGTAAGTLAGHAVGTARSTTAGAHTLRIAGARGSRARAITAKLHLQPGQLAVVVVTARRGRLVARTTSVAAGARRVLSLLPGTSKVRLGTAATRTLRHGASVPLPSSAASVTVARQRLRIASGAQLTVLVPRSRRAATVVRAA